MKNAEVKIDEEKAKAIVRNVYEYAAFFEMDPKLVLAVMRTESGFREKAKSWYGATGLMQVVPRWHLKKLKDRDPTNLVVSIEVGSQVLKDCLKRFRNDKAKGLNCYSGKGGQKYYNVVTKFERSLTAFVYDFTQQRMQVAMATKTYAYEERF